MTSRAQSQDHGTWNARRGAVLCCTANKTAEHDKRNKTHTEEPERDNAGRNTNRWVGR